MEGLKHFSCHNVLVRVTKCPFSHPHLIPSWQPPPLSLVGSWSWQSSRSSSHYGLSLGRVLRRGGRRALTLAHCAACLSHGRAAPPGQVILNHNIQIDTFRIFQCLHFLLRGLPWVEFSTASV